VAVAGWRQSCMAWHGMDFHKRANVLAVLTKSAQSANVSGDEGAVSAGHQGTWLAGRWSRDVLTTTVAVWQLRATSTGVGWRGRAVSDWLARTVW